MNDLLLRRAHLWGRDGLADVLIRDGRIAAVTGAGEAAGTAAHTEDAAGRLVVPGFVDGHAHLDKTLWGGPWVPNAAGPGLAGRIAHGRDRRAEAGVPDPDKIAALLRNMVALGTVHARSHVDVDPDLGLDGVAAVREALRRLDGRISAELVAFPQTGLLTSPGTEQLMDRALKEGVEVVGGIDPAGLDRDPVRHLDAVFGLAERHGAKVDVHLHDRGTLGAWEYELIIERTRATGLTGRVTVSHGFALSDAEPEVRARLIDGLAGAGIGLATIAPAGRLLPLADLYAAGVPVALGNDGVRDLWSPYGTGDVLERALRQAQGGGAVRDEDIERALHAATYGGARVVGFDGLGLSEGDRADLVVIDARNAAEAVAACPPRDLVVKAGRVVARGGEPV
ncbi:amidohydrolase [Nocardiopsis composta]|uniref:Cytosine deaminase n=1 Tax=Nocardiopsis composta TaxID=157465 RepID=A0A7W8QJN3_9ACTN|nr:amidohydrolase [Nocardiopsis composta]MBB5431234.1 cytosine deaminase [Nocardiopsis composta]